MQYKTLTAILAYACAAAAAILPSELVTRSEGGSSDMPYAISEMKWTGVVVKGSEPVTLYGTTESVLEQAKKINPDFQLQEVDEVETGSLEKRNMGDIICNIRSHSGKAYIPGVMNQIKYLRSLSGRCGVKARSCVRISCSWTDAVWLCNDNDHFIEPSCKYLADYAANIMNACQDVKGQACRHSTCSIGGYTHYVNGQQFDSDNYNVIVSREMDC